MLSQATISLNEVINSQNTILGILLSLLSPEAQSSNGQISFSSFQYTFIHDLFIPICACAKTTIQLLPPWYLPDAINSSLSC